MYELSVCNEICGDAKVIGSEFCDDGDLDNTTKCRSDCTDAARGFYCSGGNSTSPSTCLKVCIDGTLINIDNGETCPAVEIITGQSVFTTMIDVMSTEESVPTTLLEMHFNRYNIPTTRRRR